MRTYLICLILFFVQVACCDLAFSQEPNDRDGEIRYISDDLSTFLHAGPGRNYRILGSVVAGSRLTLLQTNIDAGFVEVIDEKQRTGWVDSQYVSSQQSIRVLVPELQESLQQATTSVHSLSADNELLNQQIADLSSQNTELKKKLSVLERDNTRISQELDEHDQTAKMEWFTRGGILAVISILIGIILTYIPKKRRRNDNWM